MLNPEPGTGAPPSSGANLMLPAGLTAAREVSGGGQSNWGAGIGFDIHSTKPDGGNNVPFWACDGGAPGAIAAGGPDVWSDAPDSGNGIPLEYDASSHKGVSFYAVSLNPNPINVQIKFSEHRTNFWGAEAPPVGTEPTCNACATKLSNPNLQCGDDYLIVKQFTTTWTQFTIHWADLATANWSKQGLPTGGFDPAHWVSMHFQFHASAAMPLQQFDVAVACVQFVDN
jgi:hypothetical protein